MEPSNSFFDKTKLSLYDTFAVNQQEFPVLKFRLILFLSDVHACSNKPYMCYSAGTHFPAENFAGCCEREFCVRRRRMSFHAVKESEISGDLFLDISNCSLAFATGSVITNPQFSADKQVDMKWVFIEFSSGFKNSSQPWTTLIRNFHPTWTDFVNTEKFS